MELKRDAALHCAFDVAGTAHFHVGFRDDKSVGGGGHDFEALAGVFGYFFVRHEYAVASV